MNPSINTIPTAQLYGNYTLWNPVEETWSEPTTYTAAVEAYARDPELQASLILPDGTTTAPAHMSEIIKRAAATRNTESAPGTPIPHPAAPRPSAAAAPFPAETVYLLHHALRLFLCVTYGTFYLTAAGAIIGGFSSGATHIGLSGLILGIITAAVHATLSGRAD
ncbi:MAG: hypothetical protein MJ074_06495 [Oscillospiraceae bacterium]|nr:hypothetical protein [Oscillospiraceae bacterium]